MYSSAHQTSVFPWKQPLGNVIRMRPWDHIDFEIGYVRTLTEERAGDKSRDWQKKAYYNTSITTEPIDIFVYKSMFPSIRFH